MSTYLVYFNDLQTITDSFEPNPAYTISDSLSIIENWTFQIEHNLSNIQTLIESYDQTNLTTRILSDVQILKNTFSGNTNNPFTIQNPIPSINAPILSSVSDPISPPGPGLGPFTEGSLRYVAETVSFTCNNLSITFKAPDFGNKDITTTKFLSKDTRGLTLIQYRDSIWPNYITYDLLFSQLDADEIDSIRFFLRASLGLVITYVDIYGLEHIGVIPDPEEVATSSSNGYSIKFTFLEGIPA